jgi:hypothetical protein
MLTFVSLCGCPRGDRIVLEATLEGVDGVGTAVAPVVARVTHHQYLERARLASLDGTTVSDLQRLALGVVSSRGGSFDPPELYVALAFSRARAAISEGPSPDPELASASGGLEWMRAHTGDLAWLTLRHEDLAATPLPQAEITGFPPGFLRRAGAAWLARVEDDDLSLAWRVAQGASGCTILGLERTLVAPPAGDADDCFDLETLLSILLIRLAIDVTIATEEGDFGIPLVIASVPVDVRAVAHRLYVIPHLRHPGTEAPGFGVVYQVDTVASTGLDVGAATLSVPLSFHFGPIAFDSATNPRYDLIIDPLGDPPVAGPWRNPGRVTVRHDGGVAGGALASGLLAGVTASLAAFERPTFDIAGTTFSFEEALELAIRNTFGTLGSVGIPHDHDVIALPETLPVVENAGSALTLGLGRIGHAQQLALTAEVKLTPAGGLTVVQPVDPEEKLFRILEVPPVDLASRWRLVFLR